MVDVLRRLYAQDVSAMASEVVSAIETDRARRAEHYLPPRFALLHTGSRRFQEMQVSRVGGRDAPPDREGARPPAAAPRTAAVSARPPAKREAPAGKTVTPKAERAALARHLLTLSPTAFEGVIERLLVALGVQEVTRTPPTNDAGVDVRGVLVIEDLMRVRVAVQVKRYAGNVSRPDVQKLRGSLSHGEVGWFFTTGGYSDGARVEAQAPDRQPISLISGLEVADLLIKYSVAATEEPGAVESRSGQPGRQPSRKR